MTLSWVWIAVAISEALAAWLIYRLWRSSDFVAFKVAFTVLALVPFIGPLFVLWFWNPPSPLPWDLRDHHGFQTDVLDRWRLRLAARGMLDPVEAWRRWMRSNNDRPSKS
jgi:hypothetical protein